MTGLRDCHMGSLLFCSALGWFHCIAATHTGHHAKVCALPPTRRPEYRRRRRKQKIIVEQGPVSILSWTMWFFRLSQGRSDFRSNIYSVSRLCDRVGHDTGVLIARYGIARRDCQVFFHSRDVQRRQRKATASLLALCVPA
jgi:hypothetical protein